MFNQKCAVLIVFIVALMLVLPFTVFSVEKSDKDAILQELSNSMDANPDILRNVILQIGDGYTMKNKTDEAVAFYEKALKVLPDNEDLLSRLANMYNQKSAYKNSADIYKKLIKLKPENTWYVNMLSNAYSNAGDKEAAAAVWDDILKKADKPDVFIQAANFYNTENNIEKAMDSAKKAVELAPDNMSYLQVLESVYVRAEKYSDAEAICNKALANSKDQWAKDWANMELVNIYQKQNKLGDLAESFEKSLIQAPKDISQYKRLGDLYQRNNEMDKSIAVYEKAMAAGLSDMDMNNRLLSLYESSNNIEKAQAQIKKMMADSPQDTFLYERLANLLANAGKKEDAKKIWGELLSKLPNDASVSSRYGDKLNEWGDSDGAVAQFRKAQSLDVNNLWYAIRVADIFIAKGKTDAAKKELNDIIAKTKDAWMKQEAERRINDLDARPKEMALPGAVSTAQAIETTQHVPAVVPEAHPPALIKEQITPPKAAAQTKKAEKPARGIKTKQR